MTPLLEAHGLTVIRPGDSGPVTVLDGVDLTVDAGTLVEVAGPSGSGKTTLLLALARLLPGATGGLALDGVPATGIAPRVWRTRVALLPQRAALVPGTVADNLRVPWTLHVREHETAPADDALRSALDGVGLEDVALDRDASRLSVGQAARVALLRTTLTSPRVLLLDEPDASLDDASAREVARVITGFVARGGAVVRVSHVRLDGNAHRRYLLEDGQLIDAAFPARAGGPSAVAQAEGPWRGVSDD